MTEQYTLFIFDLDNTLIDENTYLFEAYRQIAAYTHRQYPQYQEALLHDMLVTTYNHTGRTRLLNTYIDQFHLPSSEMDNLLTILRTAKLNKKLALLPGMETLLSKLISRDKQLSIATNGNKLQQQNKIDQVNWGTLHAAIPVYFAADYEPKPSPLVIHAIINDHGVAPERVLFIGDSKSDEQAAHHAGIDFCFVSAASSYLNI